MNICNILSYKGYLTMPLYSEEDGIYYGCLLGIRDVCCFHGRTIDEFITYFHESVDNYIWFNTTKTE
jgi:predicted HicB family RNase H-like nuclease